MSYAITKYRTYRRKLQKVRFFLSVSLFYIFHPLSSRYRLYVHQILPKLKFLDSEPLILKVTEETRNPTSFVLELTHSKMISRQKSQSAAITIYKNPEESKAAKNKLSFGKLRYKYSGKHSEGNRFIGNKDL